ncbi:MAG: S8 family serine peptidase [Lachnospiraceae bacterium]|nr:S8 family serine peptidase [Lachnospiraceae bacterium]
MSKIWRRFWALLLTVVLVMTAVPASARAEGEDKVDEYADRGIELELEDLNPAQIDVSRLDQITEEPASVEAPLYSEDDIVRVSIVLDKPSTLDKGFSTKAIAQNQSALNYRDSLKNDQAAVTAAIETATKKSLDVKWNLTLAVNIISANVRYGDIDIIKAVKGVKDVEIENRYEPAAVDQINTAVTSESMTGATSAWTDGYTGAGSRIAIIDTGTAYNHKSFDPEALEYSYEVNAEKAGLSVDEYKAGLNLLDEAGIDAVLDQLNANNTAAKHNIAKGADAYKNVKNAFAYNYVDGNNNTDHSGDTQGEHGSHVSGIAAANRYVKSGDEFVEAALAEGAVGMAPDAQVLTMKVFGRGGGAYDSDYMAAIEDAIILGADSVNLSLGSSAAGVSLANTYQAVMDSLVASDTVVTISMGNSYAWDEFVNTAGIFAEDNNFHTGGSPGSFVNSLAIASAENIGSIGMPVVFNDNQSVFYTETESGGARMKSIAGSYEYVYIDALGNPAEYSTVNPEISLSGKIVMVNRGSINFSAKGNNLKSYQPAALIVANNQAGTINMALDDYTGTFPMVSITLADADTIKENSTKTTIGAYDVYTGTVTITDTVSSALNMDRADTEMSDFSSWGAPDSLILKPELTTPGGNIWSVNGMTDTDYEIMSGTSMAAPHAAGLAGVLAQYIREEDVLAKAQEVSGKPITQRGLINSLLMSTASAMKNDGEYLPIIEVGAGLADVYAATQAKSFILMNEDATASYADGKVKAELGQDAAREGKYSYSFTINNLTEEILKYQLNTDLFTQATFSYGGAEFLDYVTEQIDADVTYTYPTIDVDGDGALDANDVQAILDYVTGILSDADIDAESADFDVDGNITSYDAQLLVEWLAEYGTVSENEVVVPGNSVVEVTVDITLADSAKETLDRKGGAYIEGYTFATSTRVSSEGVIEDVEHSIPILGYFGSWTDASMFDDARYTDKLYGESDKTSYWGNGTSNYLSYSLSGKTNIVTGNPYAVEDTFPADRLAINGNAIITSANFAPIRNGVGVGVVAKEDGSVVYNTNLSTITKAYYSQSNGAWYNNTASNRSIGANLAGLGLSNNDKIIAGYFSVPEYYTLLVNPEATTGNNISASDIVKLYLDGEIGDGAFIGYHFTIDNDAPVIKSAERSSDFEKITVTVQDNAYIAYLAIADVSGKTIYLDAVPEQTEEGEEIVYTFNLSDTDADLGNGVAVFVGDYAGNENAAFVRLGRGPVYTQKEIFVPATEIVEGGTYMITNGNEVGSVKALASTGAAGYTIAVDAEVQEDENGGLYIDSESIEGLVVFNAVGAYSRYGQLLQDAVGQYMSYMSWSNRAPYMSSSWADVGYTYNAENTTLLANTSRSVSYNDAQGNFLFVSNNRSTGIYLWTTGSMPVEIDPDEASEVVVSPAEATLFTVEGLDTVELSATITPIVLANKNVIWTSSDESVAIVDEKGVVTAISEGTAIITATSEQTPDVSGTAVITVANNTSIDAYAYGQITVGDEPTFVLLDGWDGSAYDVAEGWTELQGGGRSGNYIYGIDVDDDYVRFDIADDFTPELLFAMNNAYAPLDGAAIPVSIYSEYDEEGNVTASGEIAYDLVAAGPTYLELFIESSLTGWTYPLRAIAFVGINADEETGNVTYYYYGLNSDGELEILAIFGSGFEDGEVNLSLQTGTLGTIEGPGFVFSDDTYAYSMDYLGFNTYEEWADMGQEGVLLADKTYNCIWFISTDEESEDYLKAQIVGIPEGATNIAALFNNDLDSIETLVGEDEAAEPDKNIVLPADVVASLNAHLGKNKVSAAKIANDISSTKTDGAVNRTTGSLNALSARKVDADQQKVGKSTTTELDFTEDKDVYNGYIEISYDKDAISVENFESNTEFSSINHDAENGSIRYAYVNVDPILAGDLIAKLTVSGSCEETELVVATKERNDSLELNETESIPVAVSGHIWNEPVWEWAEYYSSATATFICKNVETHTEVLDAVITVEKTTEKTTYTATVEFEGKTYTDTVEVENPAATITSASLTLQSRIDANIYVDAPESAAKIVLTYSKDGSTVEYDLATATKESNGTYKTVFPNIPAKEMTEVISVTVLDAEGNELPLAMQTSAGKLNGNAYEYRVVDWPIAVLAAEGMDEKYVNIAKAILNYGQTAQIQFNYKTDDLANPEGYLADEMKTVVANPDYDAVFPTEEELAAIGYKQMSLNLEGATEIFLYFDHEVTAKDEEGNAYKVEASGSNYRVVIENIVAKELNKAYTVIITEDGVDYTFTLCALSYANRVLALDGYETLKDVCKALYLYNDAAIKAFN